MPSIEPIERPETLSGIVCEKLEAFIITNGFSPGETLPTERELASRFGVSRTVVREAVRALVTKGLLEVYPGSGTVIRRPSSETVSQAMVLYLHGATPAGLAPDKITEVRRLLEVEIAGLAAERRTGQDLETLRAILDRYPEVVSKPKEFVAWDVGFHLATAKATQNELLWLLLNSISDIMSKVRELGVLVPGAAETALRFHTTIFKQIELGSRDGARQAMREHIDHSERIMAAALAANPKTEEANTPKS